MPSTRVFAACGFFIRPGFFDAADCAQLAREMSAAPSEPGRVVQDGVDGILDETSRRVSSARVSKATRQQVKQRLDQLTPDLAAHFQTPLSGCELPGFLIYEAGAFLAAHKDTGPLDPPELQRRRISAIVFLNQPGPGSGREDYSGGTLRFHGLLDGPQWEHCPLPFEAEAGMLVAFPSHVLHEVETVKHGRRITVVTWFLAA
jgi:predicted 2-oxoglutarate/Fe(II)-dependent dioxygenase YbiX